MFNIIALFIGVFVIVIFLNVYIIRYIIKKALEKFIKPKLAGEGVIFSHYKWLGFFDHGDFKDEEFALVPSSRYGASGKATYIDVYYFEALVEKHFTARID